MYLSEYAEPGLSGFKLKKLARSIKRSVTHPIRMLKDPKATIKADIKKAIPVAHVAAAYFTGGSSIPASLAIEKARAEKKRMAEEEAKMQAEINAMSQATAQVAPAAAPMTTVKMTAPTAAAVSQAQPMPTVPSFAPVDYGMAPAPQAAPQAMPKWLLPVGLGAAGLVMVALLAPRR